MDLCRQAVILAAGRGSRLRPHTDQVPKCLVEVAGRTLLDGLIAALAGSGVEQALVVVGYRASDVSRYLGARAAPLAVELVENAEYQATNNSFSLWLARERIRPPFVLIEGDVWLSREVMAQLVRADRLALAVGADAGPGSHARVAGSRITGLEVGCPRTPAGAFKTVNAASFSAAWWHEWFEPMLARLIAGGHRDSFYERAIAEALECGAPPLEPLFVADRDWVEVDTPDDLVRAHTVVNAAAAP